ncbi:uncharacterized protein LOC112528509 [Cynara cardunculus var. scolymus]|uniref:uncharacterized protein LOC112528509 n=1 Tax=Cynara cardunculus var. scolymus TaxID=59895 RepID=UPI000D62658D|nr:uncharacterized protein LOC112528509 [Cynara cardunculus var. scolymus]
MKKLSTTSAAVDTAAADLKTLIHDHAQFFDKLIELIPAKFYLPTDEDSKPWFQGLSKGKKASLKQQTRENIKKSRRDRLDPEKAQTTTLDLLKKIVGKNEDSDEEDDDDDEEEEEIEIRVKPVTNFDGETGKKSVTYEELQQRLHSKLQLLRANRGQGKRSMMMNERKERVALEVLMDFNDYNFVLVQRGFEELAFGNAFKSVLVLRPGEKNDDDE